MKNTQKKLSLVRKYIHPVLNNGFQFGWRLLHFSWRRVNLLLWVFIIMTQIKVQAIIVRNLLGSYKEMPSREKFRMFSVCCVPYNWSLCPNSNILPVIRIAPLSSQKYSQYKQVLEFQFSWCRDCVVVSCDEPPLSFSLPRLLYTDECVSLSFE